MELLAGKAAVVTGAASGIGLALARAEASLRDAGVECVAVRTDVSRAEDVEALAERAERAFGALHVVCNNAGVFACGLA